MEPSLRELATASFRLDGRPSLGRVCPLPTAGALLVLTARESLLEAGTKFTATLLTCADTGVVVGPTVLDSRVSA